MPSLRKAGGGANVVAMDLNMGAEDFSFYAREVPGFFFVGATPRGQDALRAPSNHSPAFWHEVEARFPAWRDERAWFHAEGRRLKARLRGLLAED